VPSNDAYHESADVSSDTDLILVEGKFLHAEQQAHPDLLEDPPEDARAQIAVHHLHHNRDQRDFRVLGL
jgi:hypothetical protein